MIPTLTLIIGLLSGIYIGGALVGRHERKRLEADRADLKERTQQAAVQIGHAYDAANRAMKEAQAVIAESRQATREAMAEATEIAKLAARTMFCGAEVTEPPAPSSVRDADKAAAQRMRQQG